MDISFTKGQSSDRVEARRTDGSVVATSFPHKGPVPHDAVHLFVEAGLGITNGFWGLVEGGRHPDEVQDLAKAAGHSSASRAVAPDPSFIPVIQAERIVECFEADLWGDGGNGDSLRDMVRAGCEQSHVPDFPMSDAAIDSVRKQLADFRDRWVALDTGGMLSLTWHEGQAA